MPTGDAAEKSFHLRKKMKSIPESDKMSSAAGVTHLRCAADRIVDDVVGVSYTCIPASRHSRAYVISPLLAAVAAAECFIGLVNKTNLKYCQWTVDCQRCEFNLLK